MTSDPAIIQPVFCPLIYIMTAQRKVSQDGGDRQGH